MGRLARRRLAIGTLVAGLVASGCASGPDGVLHKVRPGENVYRISRRYGVSADEIVRANGIRDVRKLQIGTRLWIPYGRISAASRGRGATQVAMRPPGYRSMVKRETKLDFGWPVRGRLTSRFGRRHGRLHEGVDVSARSGTKIRAAEAGVVTHSGGGLGAYGRVVIVKHTGHYSTVYAHNRRNRVRRGDFVDRGQVIGEVGSTGNATGPHVHFEIRYKDQPLDPLGYLP